MNENTATDAYTSDIERFVEPEQRTCFICGDYDRKDRMDTIDISREDEYYPVVRYVCWHCSKKSGGDER